jgi:thiamine-phosphate pyrophosphorylase
VDARLYLCAPASADDAVLRAALRGGVEILQLRDRTLDDDAILREAARFKALAAETGARFVLNDRPDLAAASGAEGVHLGQDDMHPAQARDIVGPGAIIGRSTHAPVQGAAAAADPDVDYVSIGPVWPTPTKPGRPAAGIDYVRWAAANVDKPWFAIGGVDETTIHEVVAAGAHRVVVVRAVLEATDPERAATRLRAAMEALHRA